ncbi:cupin domain-containing protein [Cupriavidus necator]
MNQSSPQRPSVRVYKEIANPVLDVFGPTVQFLTAPAETDETHCVMRCVIPPGGVVPLHSHAGIECFLMLSGEQEVLVETNGTYSWTLCSPGDFIQVPSEAKHAFRNLSDKLSVSLVTTTAVLGRFFEEIGRPVSANDEPMPPTPEAIQYFVATAIRSGYWLATPEENAAVGLAVRG